MNAQLSIVNWNLANRVDGRRGHWAHEQGEYIRSFSPNLVLLQEGNPRSIQSVSESAELDWIRFSLDHRVAMPGEGPGRRIGCAIGGRGTSGGPGRLITDVPVPERTLVTEVDIGGLAVTAGSFHAPPGVNWFEKKPAQAVKIAQWLQSVQASPTLFGIDANTPAIDHPDFARTRTHWHTGDRSLNGAPGDDQLVGPDKIHDLSDALRVWLNDHPDEYAQLCRDFPDGPLCVSHRTGKRGGSEGTPHRYDSIWITDHFNVESIEYHYDQACRLSDHALVHAVLELKP